MDTTPTTTPAPVTSFLMSVWHTLKTNCRDVFFFIILGLGLAVAGGVIDYVARLFGDSRFMSLVLPTVSNYLQGFSRFMGASICATFIWMLLWHTVNHYGNQKFAESWGNLSEEKKFFTYVGLICVALIGACICFSA